MGRVSKAFIIGMGTTILTVLGDVFIKHASGKTAFSGWLWLLLGAIIYGATALGWFLVMRRIKLITAGVLFSLMSVILLTLGSVYIFQERLNFGEISGIALAIVSLVLLARFA